MDHPSMRPTERTMTVLPQVTEGTAVPAIENRHRIRYDPAGRESARIIRTITEE